MYASKAPEPIYVICDKDDLKTIINQLVRQFGAKKYAIVDWYRNEDTSLELFIQLLNRYCSQHETSRQEELIQLLDIDLNLRSTSDYLKLQVAIAIDH